MPHENDQKSELCLVSVVDRQKPACFQPVSSAVKSCTACTAFSFAVITQLAFMLGSDRSRSPALPWGRRQNTSEEAQQASLQLPDAELDTESVLADEGPHTIEELTRFTALHEGARVQVRDTAGKPLSFRFLPTAQLQDGVSKRYPQPHLFPCLQVKWSLDTEEGSATKVRARCIVYGPPGQLLDLQTIACICAVVGRCRE